MPLTITECNKDETNIGTAQIDKTSYSCYNKEEKELTKSLQSETLCREEVVLQDVRNNCLNNENEQGSSEQILYVIVIKEEENKDLGNQNCITETTDLTNNIIENADKRNDNISEIECNIQDYRCKDNDGLSNNVGDKEEENQRLGQQNSYTDNAEFINNLFENQQADKTNDDNIFNQDCRTGNCLCKINAGLSSNIEDESFVDISNYFKYTVQCEKIFECTVDTNKFNEDLTGDVTNEWCGVSNINDKKNEESVTPSVSKSNSNSEITKFINNNNIIVSCVSETFIEKDRVKKIITDIATSNSENEIKTYPCDHDTIRSNENQINQDNFILSNDDAMNCNECLQVTHATLVANDAATVRSDKNMGRKRKRKARKWMFRKKKVNKVPLLEPDFMKKQVSNSRIENQQKLKSLIPENSFKTYKKSLAKMTRNDLEKICIMEIVKSILKRCNLNQIQKRVKLMSETIDEYRRRTEMLVKQNRDLLIILKVIQESQKQGDDRPIYPLKVTRSVGVQALVTDENQSKSTPLAPNYHLRLKRKRKLTTKRMQQLEDARRKKEIIANNSNKIDSLTQNEPTFKSAVKTHAQRTYKTQINHSPRSLLKHMQGLSKPVCQSKFCVPVVVLHRLQMNLNNVPVATQNGERTTVSHTNSSSPLDAPQCVKHPAPLPANVTTKFEDSNWKAKPPAPYLKLSRVKEDIIISWIIEGFQEDLYEKIAGYQIYAYKETHLPPSTDFWKKIAELIALPLPMECKLSGLMPGCKYYFAVRAVDVRSRLGPFSLLGSIHVLRK